MTDIEPIDDEITDDVGPKVDGPVRESVDAGPPPDDGAGEVPAGTPTTDTEDAR